MSQELWDSPSPLSPALSWVPISNSEQPRSLLVPAWPAINQASCIRGISPGPVPAQKGLHKSACSYLSALESPPLCRKLLWTSLRCTAHTTLETWTGEFSSQTQEGRTLPAKKEKNFLQSPEPFPSHLLNCHSCLDFSYCPGADLWWRWLLNWSAKENGKTRVGRWPFLTAHKHVTNPAWPQPLRFIPVLLL